MTDVWFHSSDEERLSFGAFRQEDIRNALQLDGITDSSTRALRKISLGF